MAVNIAHQATASTEKLHLQQLLASAAKMIQDICECILIREYMVFLSVLQNIKIMNEFLCIKNLSCVPIQLPICICFPACGSVREAASMICDHVAWPSGLYNHKQTQAGQLHSIISKRSKLGNCIHALVSGQMLQRYALETGHGYAITFIIHSTNTIWRPHCPICKHMARLKEWGAKGDRALSELLVRPLTVCLNESVTVLNRPGPAAGARLSLAILKQLHASKDTHTDTVMKFVARPQHIQYCTASYISVQCVLCFCASHQCKVTFLNIYNLQS